MYLIIYKSLREQNVLLYIITIVLTIAGITYLFINWKIGIVFTFGALLAVILLIGAIKYNLKYYILNEKKKT